MPLIVAVARRHFNWVWAGIGNKVDDKKKLEDEVVVAPKRGSGSLLAAARKQQNKTVKEIAHELNLSVTQIRTIELDQSEGLPEPTYVRGYIRSYARLLGLNVDEVLDHYLNPNWQKGTRLDDMPRGIGNAYESDPRGFLTTGKVIAIVALVVLGGFLWFTGQLNSLAGKQAASLVVSAYTAQSLTSVDSPAELDKVTGDVSADDQTEIGDEVNGDVAVSDAVPVENKLRLSFTDSCWVDIRDGDGNRLAYKSYAEGEELTVLASTSMSVFLGNAKAVAATFNDTAYDISQYREGVFARFTLGE
jgi:cytoskeleton protein RodZ